MKIDSTAVPTGKRIAGTLHTRGYVQPAPLQDEKPPKEKIEENEVTSRHQNSGQEDHKGTR